MAIPKIIHYVWMGGKEKPPKIKKCIKTWKKHLKDYEFIEWNEKNFDINSNSFVKKMYENKKWAFVADYARTKAIYEYGGIYFDTDMEVVKNIDELLKEQNLEVIQNTENHYLIKIKTENQGYDLFKKLADSNINVTKFEFKKPTLNEIFIEKVGAM